MASVILIVMTRVFLVEDHTVLRHGLRSLLTDQPDLVVGKQK